MPGCWPGKPNAFAKAQDHRGLVFQPCTNVRAPRASQLLSLVVPATAGIVAQTCSAVRLNESPAAADRGIIVAQTVEPVRQDADEQSGL